MGFDAGWRILRVRSCANSSGWRMAPNHRTSAGDCAAAVTRLLNEARNDSSAAAALLPLVYEQLRELARSKMRQERRGHTLGATALVHEAYVRLVDQTAAADWEGRWHFFAAAAEAMRRILVDDARQKARLKRGGGMKRVSFDPDVQLTVASPPDDLLALDEALAELSRRRPNEAQLVKLRYFAGLTTEQALARALMCGHRHPVGVGGAAGGVDGADAVGVGRALRQAAVGERCDVGTDRRDLDEAPFAGGALDHERRLVGGVVRPVEQDLVVLERRGLQV